MSEVIDEKVVEMRFDNRDFEENASKSMSTIGKLKQSLNMDGATKGLENVDKAAKNIDLSGVSSAAETVRLKFSAMEVVGVTALANIANRAMYTGESMVKALTTDSVKAGLAEYEMQMNSIQTIMANTQSKGTTLKDVNQTLDELNTYADLTIYNFSQMTRNIGTFTAAGVDLDTSVSAIKGIANLAAVSGSTSQQASVAMYQLSQAIAAGTVKLQDWNSVVNAGMGGEVFQNALKDTARVHGIAIDEIIQKEGSFRESLHTGWLSSEMLTETLAKFTGDLSEAELKAIGYTDEQTAAILQMGVTANEAATKVKTFSQLVDTIQEAAGSGWALTWRTVIGDFEEARELYTGINDVISGMINNSSAARNDMLKLWKDMGGRTALIESAKNAFEALVKVITPIKEAFREIFPKTTALNLYVLTMHLRDFTKELAISDESAENLKNTFKGLFSILGVIKKVAAGFLGLISPVVKIMASLGAMVLNVTGNIGNLLSALGEKFNTEGLEKLNDFLESVHKKLEEIYQSISGARKSVGDTISETGEKIEKSKIGECLTAIGSAIKTLGSGVLNAFSTALTTLTNAVSNADFTNLTAFINALAFGGLSSALYAFSVNGILDDLRDTLKLYQTILNAKALLNIAKAIGILAASLLVMSLIDTGKLAGTVAAMGVLFAELGLMIKAFAGGGNLKDVIAGNIALSGVAGSLVSIASAMFILAMAVKSLGELDFKQLAVGVAGVGSLMAMMTATAKVMASGGKTVIKGTTSMVIFAASVKVLASACKDLAAMKFGEMTKGLVGMGALLAELSIFLNKTGGQVKLLAVSTAMVGIGVSMKIFASSMSDLGALSWGEIARGLAAMAGALVTITAALKLMPKGSLIQGTELVAVSGALIILAGVLDRMGGMSWDEIGHGLVVLGGALAILAVGLKAMQGTMVGAAAMTLAAGAVGTLAPMLAILGAMKLGAIGKSLVALGGAFTVLGVAGAVLGPVIPALLGLSAAFTLLGIGVAGIGAGLALAAAGIATFATASAVGAAAIATSLGAIVVAIAGLVPTIAVTVANGVIAFVQAIGAGAPILITAVVDILNAVLTAVEEVVPKAVTVVVDILLYLLDTIQAKLPLFMDVGADLIVKFLHGVEEHLPEVVQAGFDLIVGFLNSMADSMRKNAPILGEAIANVVTALLDAAIGIIFGFGNKFVEAGGESVEHFIKGIDEMRDTVKEAVKGIALAAVETVKNAWADFKAAGKYVIDGLLNGIRDKKNALVDGAKNAANSILNAMENTLDINSPSKKTYQIGVYTILGLINALKAMKNKLSAQTKNTINDGLLAPMNELVDETAEEMIFGAEAMRAFVEQYAALLSVMKYADYIEKARDAITDYGVKLYEESEQYQNDAEELENYQNDLIELTELRDEVQKKLETQSAERKAMSADEVAQLQSDLADIESSIEDTTQAIEDTQSQMAEHIADIYENLRSSIKEKLADSMDPLSLDITSGVDIFKSFEKNEAISANELLDNMYSQLDGVREWRDNLNALAASGLDSGLVDILKNLGIDGANYVDTFMSMTTEQMEAANQAFIESSHLTSETLLSNFSDTLNNTKEWVSKIQALAASGLNQAVVEGLGKMGVSGSEYVDAFLGMSYAEIQEFNAQYAEYLKLPEEASDSVIASFAFAGTNSAAEFRASLEETFDPESEVAQGIVDNLLILGEKMAEKLQSGIAAKESAVEDTAYTLGKSTYDGVNKNVSEKKGRSLADMMSKGLIGGLYNNQNAVKTAAEAVARSAYTAAMNALEIHSPSKAFARLGMYADAGLANGFTKFAYTAIGAAKDMGENSVKALSRTLSQVNKVINGEVELNPTIRPVLDLTDVESKSRRLNVLLSREQAYSVNTMMKANDVSEIQNGGNGEKSGNNYSFIQNNYSPKALSKADIYRATKNQFAQIKGV